MRRCTSGSCAARSGQRENDQLAPIPNAGTYSPPIGFEQACDLAIAAREEALREGRIRGELGLGYGCPLSLHGCRTATILPERRRLPYQAVGSHTTDSFARSIGRHPGRQGGASGKSIRAHKKVPPALGGTSHITCTMSRTQSQEQSQRLFAGPAEEHRDGVILVEGFPVDGE